MDCYRVTFIANIGNVSGFCKFFMQKKWSYGKNMVSSLSCNRFVSSKTL